ncbi:hypothetical protein CY35_11G069000 [Sphagnum magellanicum]|nr:hypothetical protein CY35_11G069000 [Sphagnum magellanicum]
MEEEENKHQQHAFVYRICPAEEWKDAQSASALAGGQLDLSSGFIHLSTSFQLGDGLRYDEVEGIGKFPHFYGSAGTFAPLPLSAVESSSKLKLENGKHVLPGSIE